MISEDIYPLAISPNLTGNYEKCILLHPEGIELEKTGLSNQNTKKISESSLPFKKNKTEIFKDIFR